MSTATTASPRDATTIWFCVGAAICGLVALALLGLEEPMAAGIVLATPILPFVIYAFVRGFAGERSYGPLFAAGIIIAISVNFRFREYGDKSIDAQVILKLVALAAAGAVTLLGLKRILRLFSLDGYVIWVAFFTWLVVSSSYAFVPMQSLVYSGSLLASFLFLSHLCMRYGRDRLVDIQVWAGLVLCVTSLIVYIAVPTFGRFAEWYGNDLVLTSRLQGIFGSPNGAGMAAGPLFFLTAAFYYGRPGSSRLVGLATLGASGICLLLSINRMALACVMISAASYYLMQSRFGVRLLLIAAIGILIAAPVLLFPEEVFGLVSRTGSPEEISSGTGRSRIWPVVLDLIPKSWLIGYGYGSAIHVLANHPDLFDGAAHCHNLYLETMFSSGIIGLTLLILCILTTFVTGFRIGAAKELALFMYFLPFGLTEPVFSGMIYCGMMVWMTAMVLVYERALEPNRRQQGASEDALRRNGRAVRSPLWT